MNASASTSSPTSTPFSSALRAASCQAGPDESMLVTDAAPLPAAITLNAPV